MYVNNFFLLINLSGIKLQNGNTKTFDDSGGGQENMSRFYLFFNGDTILQITYYYSYVYLFNLSLTIIICLNTIFNFSNLKYDFDFN